MAKRNYFWDFFKFIAAIGVILGHVQLDGYPGKIMFSVGTFGVSFFLLISGYSCYGDKDKMCPVIIRRLKRNGIITAGTVALYLVFSYFIYRIDGKLPIWKEELSKPVTYIKMLFIGDFEFFCGTPLWFMVALIYGYLVFLIIARFNLRKAVYILVPVFVIARIVVDVYVSSYGASWHLCANVLIGALPMMFIGYVIADKKDKLLQIPTHILIICSVIAAIGMFLTICFNVGNLCIVQPFNILCSTLVFLLGIKKPDWYIVRPIAYLGKEDSLYIYLFHFMIFVIINEILGDRQVASWQRSLMVIVASVLFARVLSMTVQRIKSKSAD